MQEILDILMYRLSIKGITPMELPRLLKDILYIIGDGGEFTTYEVNSRLETLGWGESVVDQYTFELIIALLEMEGDFEVKSSTIH